MNKVEWFSAIDAEMIEQVGGKAVNLGIMTSAGLPVPGGFCVTTAAYRAVVGSALDELIEAISAADSAELPALASAARDRVLGLELPSDLAGAITAGYAEFGPNAPVAVRSSATAEDLAYASFAGQQDTYLNVVGETALLDAVRRCWASLWTDRAVAYRQANGIDQASVSLAVVVQQMVEVSVAGVMFTANPVTGSRAETVIDASPGLGEAVVSGAVNPDHFVLDSRTGKVRQRRLGDKSLVILATAGGGTEQQTRDAVDEPCLSDPELSRLTALGRQVTEHYGAPQDTEWALDDQGRFWLTQARPITTLFPQPPVSTSGPRIYFCMSLAQGLTRPLTPAGLSTFRLVGASLARLAGNPLADPRSGPQAIQVIGQRLFLDLTPVITSAVGRRLALFALGAMEKRSATVLESLVQHPRFAPVAGSSLTAIRGIFRVVVLRAKMPLRVLTAVVAPASASRRIAGLERRIRALLTVPANTGPEQRLAMVERQIENGLFVIMPTAFAYPATGLILLNRARHLLGELARPDEWQTVLRGLPHNVTTEMDLELWQLTEQVRDDPQSAAAFGSGSVAELTASYRARTLPAAAQRGVTAFLRRYGHRAVAEIDLGMPRWSDDPSHIIGVITNYLRLDDPALAPAAQFARGAAEAEAMRSELVARMAARSPVKARLVAFALGRARQLIGLRESPKFILIVALGLLREQLTKVGEALVDRGAIELVDDVFFLDFDQARRGLGGESMIAVVTAAREAYAIELRRRRIPRLLLSDGTEPEALADAVVRPDGALAGSPASPGTITGPARVVLDPVGAHLEPGEILIAPSTDPGWTPLFLTAGGLVMEMGGSNSHGAVVAREYGIPAVVGVPDATHLIETGQLVTVDGAAGLVMPAAD